MIACFLWVDASSDMPDIVQGTLTAQKYRDDILDAVVHPFMQIHAELVEFQHDNGTPHSARISRQYLHQDNINVMEWPSKFPDLSP